MLAATASADTVKTPSQYLNVNSITFRDGTVQVTSPTAGGGSGTITGVTAGTGLLGGGTSGNVTVSLASASINNTSTLQSGATFFVSSGTVSTLNVTSIKFPNGTIQVSSPTSGGSATPAGANTQIQYNNNGAFGASPNLSWDNANTTLYISSSDPNAATYGYVVTTTNNGYFLVMDLSSSTIYTYMSGSAGGSNIGANAGLVLETDLNGTDYQWTYGTDGTLDAPGGLIVHPNGNAAMQSRDDSAGDMTFSSSDGNTPFGEILFSPPDPVTQAHEYDTFGGNSFELHLDKTGSNATFVFTAGGELTTPYNVTLSTAPPNDFALCLSGGVLGHCTSVVAVDGSCTCVAP